MESLGSCHLKDIDEKFCQCPICLQQYKEPKLLPCLHRYCSDCVKQLIDKNKGAIEVACPECRDKFTIPPEGVNGFKTDFYMENIIEYITIQKSLANKQQRECYGCSKKFKITSYCCKCHGLLCEACHEFHMTNKILQDHRQHLLSLEDLESKRMALEKLADLKEAPRCESHPEDLCRLCCGTCNNLPICVTCTYGCHKNHDINDVGIIAAGEREKLKYKLNDLSRYRERMKKVTETVDRGKEELVWEVTEKKKHFTVEYKKNIETMKMEIKKLEDKYNCCQSEIEEEKKENLIKTTKQMDEEIKRLKMKYDNVYEEIKEECRIKLEDLKHKQEEKLQKSKGKLEILEKDFQTFIITLETTQREGLQKFQALSQQITEAVRRYENLSTTGYTFLQTKNDWTAVQCIPDTCKAIETLRKDMTSEFPELETLSRARVSPQITEDKKSPVKVEGIQTKSLRMTGITGGDDGSIVITGPTSTEFQSHITIINMEGKVLHQKEVTSTLKWPFRYSAYLTKCKIATNCTPNEIGVFDIRDHSYVRKSIRDVISKWPVGRNVMCITTDSVQNYILVGGYHSRDVYVFDDHLNYHHIMTLPKMIEDPFDMTINADNLLVCDRGGKRAYIVNYQGLEGELIYELTKPDLKEDDWNPISTCTDSKRCIYILWRTGDNFSLGRRVVAQYTNDGRQLLNTKQIDASDARCIAVVRTGTTENLLVATWKSEKVYIYNVR